MIPNRFPDEGQTPEYNTVDATLWYFEAIRAYREATGDEALLRDLFPVLQDIVDWHVRGTRYQIRVDPADGLLYAGEPGVQLTWMDAKVDDWVVTPRIGKPVEVNALWYSALCIMAEFARLLDQPLAVIPAQAGIHGRKSRSELYETLAGKARAGFARFWNAEAGYCCDVLDGPEAHDPALRPNPLSAVSLPLSPLAPEQQKAVVDACARHLLTSHGLRSLDPRHSDYRGRHGGDPPFTPRCCIAQAWTVAEVLRVWKETLWCAESWYGSAPVGLSFSAFLPFQPENDTLEQMNTSRVANAYFRRRAQGGS